MENNITLIKWKAFLTEKVDFKILKTLLLISFFSSFLALIDGGGIFFIPIILGSYIVYQFYETKQRIKYITFFLPFIFVLIFFTAGGSFLIHFNEEHLFSNSSLFATIFTGLFSSYVVLLIIWMLFKGKLQLFQFLILTVLIPIPYLLGLYADKERADIFLFYFLWNAGLSVALSSYFLGDKKSMI